MVAPPKALIIWPKMTVMSGCETPLAIAATEPTSISSTSVPSAYRKRPVNDTLFPASFFSSFFPSFSFASAAAALIARVLVLA
ncbi:hypothetical protein PR202_gb05091 [Eleusine coracana subsp. coracana]|uniref:Uncharacterized protein n=1 Tax=Eleusine coracana subsp. coracana TaxID=191504 RepID=A0AAV5E716_ELECO|nr:hypothetical protein PR202_gb05091 [Eleusine coracana subsp. coracana]